MLYDICSHTDMGLRRGNNEDSVEFDVPTNLCVLADGMGGYNAGEVASSMATSFIKTELGRWLTNAGDNAQAKEVRRVMEICVDSANRSILDASKANPEYAGMGTTLVVGVFQEDRLILGHIGDSRCYRLRGGVLHQLTKDHSFLQEQIDAGAITPEQALTSVNRNLVTRALGVEEMAFLESNEYKVEAHDVYLMCSDGLSDMVSDQKLADILHQDDTLEAKSKVLIDTANAHGGRDNISVLLVRAKPSPAKPGLLSKLLSPLVP